MTQYFTTTLPLTPSTVVDVEEYGTSSPWWLPFAPFPKGTVQDFLDNLEANSYYYSADDDGIDYRLTDVATGVQYALRT